MDEHVVFVCYFTMCDCICGGGPEPLQKEVRRTQNMLESEPQHFQVATLNSYAAGSQSQSDLNFEPNSFTMHTVLSCRVVHARFYLLFLQIKAALFTHKYQQ